MRSPLAPGCSRSRGEDRRGRLPRLSSRSRLAALLAGGPCARACRRGDAAARQAFEAAGVRLASARPLRCRCLAGSCCRRERGQGGRGSCGPRHGAELTQELAGLPAQHRAGQRRQALYRRHGPPIATLASRDPLRHPEAQARWVASGRTVAHPEARLRRGPAARARPVDLGAPENPRLSGNTGSIPKGRAGARPKLAGAAKALFISSPSDTSRRTRTALAVASPEAPSESSIQENRPMLSS
jgi:hypothetical protein